MRRIETTFAKANGPLLNIYFTAGHPEIESTRFVLRSLQESGVDMVEIGMPYSDPLADGPTIQESSTKALKNGMSIEVLFEQLKGMRGEIIVPVVLMGYLNPIMQYGEEKFCQKCSEAGIDGIIIPDLPMELFDSHYASLFAKYDLDFVFLVTPDTEEDRLRELDKRSSGFIYIVSSSSTTGSLVDPSINQYEYFKRLDGMNLKNKRMIGFGISDQESFNHAASLADGAIIGSAFIKQLGQDSSKDGILSFIKSIRPTF